MANRKFLLGILVMALIFGMTVIGCEEEEEPPPPPPSTPQPGDKVSDPIDRIESIALGTMTSSDSGWQQLLGSIQSTRKYINLDLSACTMEGTEFNPVSTIMTGKSYIVSIILPTAATSIVAGINSDSSAFNYFLNLKSISGANITTIGDYSFYGSLTLESVDFPKATTIGKRAFSVTGLKTVNFPQVTIIGEDAFSSSTLQSASFPLLTTVSAKAFSSSLMTLNIPSVTKIEYWAFQYGNTELSITMGSASPILEAGIFNGNLRTKVVRVKVPSGATGYSPFSGSPVTVSGTDTTVNWANGFRGGGWNGSAFTTSLPSTFIVQDISLTIEQQ